VGYMLGGLDWTDTALGQAFKSQEQVLFLFAGFIFIISVTLHMFSIPEQPFAPSSHLKDKAGGESTSQLSLRPIGHTPHFLDAIAEEDASARAPSREDNKSDSEEGEMDFFVVDRVRSKSDSILAMPAATIELDSDLDPDMQLFLPQFQHFRPETDGELEDVFKPSNHSIGSSSLSGAQPALSDGMMVLEHTNPDRPVLRGPTNGPPSLLQITSGLEDSHWKTCVKSAVVKASMLCVGTETNGIKLMLQILLCVIISPNFNMQYMELFRDGASSLCLSPVLSFSLCLFNMYVCARLMSQHVKSDNCADAALSSSDDCSAMEGHAATVLPCRLSNTSPRPHPHIFYRQVRFPCFK